MKKLTLNLQHIEGSQVLTREQLKKVLGGNALVTTQGNCTISRACADGKTVSCTGNGSSCYSNVTCADGASGVRCNDDEPICCAKDED